MNDKYYYLTNCTEMRSYKIINIINNSTEITRATFVKHTERVCRLRLEEFLGYVTKGKGMRVSDDCYITYHKSKWKGVTIYYLRHSCIEYIFVKGEKDLNGQ